MFARSLRTETRSKAKEDVKKVINSIDYVRKWEKKWIHVKDTSLKVYKWVPSTDQAHPRPKPKPFMVSEKAHFALSGPEGTETSQSSYQSLQAQSDLDSENGNSNMSFPIPADSALEMMDDDSKSESPEFSVPVLPTSEESTTDGVNFSVVNNENLPPPPKRIKPDEEL